jgi:hypothetical protein
MTAKSTNMLLVNIEVDMGGTDGTGAAGAGAGVVVVTVVDVAMRKF